ncbi:MAG: zinc-ribbon domain-containing protein [Deltaproteobacteria bacterium]|nr:zinc-ribbon domain-containing protein [Deltaproteobacteria bacterium]
MEISCPTCQQRYRIGDANIPPDKRVVATCKNCGAKIVIQEKAPSVDENAPTLAMQRPSVEMSQSYDASHEQKDTGQFRFIQDAEPFLGYAGFWKRAAAAIIDMVSLMVTGGFIGAFVGGFYGAITGTTADSDVLGRAVGILVGWLYYAIMESSEKHATLGKLAVGIKVIDISGEGVSFARATARHFAKILSAIPLALGYIAVAFTKKKQGFHDMIAGCLVVNSR